MILIDANQVFFSSILSTKDPLQEDLIRHIITNALRNNISKFKEYNNPIICLDSKSYWRKEVFPHYKAHRKETRDKSPLDWNLIFKVLNQYKDDLKEHFPYKTIEVDGAEADDIIGTLAPRFAQHEKVIIISSDQDFLQLQKYPNVKQYNPSLNVFLTSKDPNKDLKEKIIKGDRGDGIPSILSANDTFITKTRQKPITQKFLQESLEKDPKEYFQDNVYQNYLRNQTLIDFNYIPEDIKTNIINEYNIPKTGTKNTLYKYLVNYKLINLVECINDF
jgi:5'-3' exonuclease